MNKFDKAIWIKDKKVLRRLQRIKIDLDKKNVEEVVKLLLDKYENEILLKAVELARE